MPLGPQPVHQSLVLSIKAAFTHTITPPSAPLPSGTTAWIELWDNAAVTLLDTWNGTVTPSAVTWLVPPASANAIPTNSRYRLYVQTPGSPSYPQLWHRGPVIRDE
ncbi:hypothetical protein ACFXG4_27075 [Nocardia sp. NPDC059246]|uniref:LtfC-like domain-containing protein n=1 Tax=unclassified Nocardia TaxID=2637762 RepID=UPI0036A4108C